MPVEFDPVLTEMTQRGTTAAMLLDAQRRMSATCVEEVLKKIDRAVESSATTPELAMAWCHELAAFRRMVYRHQQEVQVGQSARRAMES
jgi:hypothetical protein